MLIFGWCILWLIRPEQNQRCFVQELPINKNCVLICFDYNSSINSIKKHWVESPPQAIYSNFLTQKNPHGKKTSTNLPAIHLENLECISHSWFQLGLKETTRQNARLNWTSMRKPISFTKVLDVRWFHQGMFLAQWKLVNGRNVKRWRLMQKLQWFYTPKKNEK